MCSRVRKFLQLLFFEKFSVSSYFKRRSGPCFPASGTASATCCFSNPVFSVAAKNLVEYLTIVSKVHPRLLLLDATVWKAIGEV